MDPITDSHTVLFTVCRVATTQTAAAWTESITAMVTLKRATIHIIIIRYKTIF